MTVRRHYSRHTMALRRRDEFPYLLNRLGLTGEGVEVGVFRGEFAELVLDSWKGSKYHLVDPWMVYAEEMGAEGHPLNQEAFDHIYESVLRRVDHFGDRADVMRMPSLDAATCFADGTLDFVYIDGLHTYQAVYDDATAWYPKLKPGGLMAGHDYAEGPRWEVKPAMDRFAKERGLTLGTTQRDQPSWFFFIPGGV